MTLKEQIMKLQTYKMFEGEDTVYVERDDVIKALEQKDRYKKVLIKDHDAEPITYRGILDTEENIVYMKNEPVERLERHGFTIEEMEE